MSTLAAFLKALPAFWELVKFLEAEYEKHQIEGETRDAVKNVRQAFVDGSSIELRSVLNGATKEPAPSA